MSEWFDLSHFIAFVLGVMLSAMVKGWVSSARSAVKG